MYVRAGRLWPERGHVVYNLPPAGGGSGGRRRRMPADFGLPAGPLVLYVGKCSPGKGYPVFVEAARLVRQRRPDTSFVVAGEGPPEWMAREPDVRLLGPRPHAEVEELYALADVVVHPAVWPEPFSRVPLEAATFADPGRDRRRGSRGRAPAEHAAERRARDRVAQSTG